jgi:hypothetical protein
MNPNDRSFAPKLAQLSAEDRQWLYGQLSLEEQARLISYLSGDDEIPTVNLAPQPAPRHVPTAEEFVAGASAWQAAQALADEPEWMVAVLLSRRAWPWTDEYLNGMDGARRDKILGLGPLVKNASRDRTYARVIEALQAKMNRLKSQNEGAEVFEGGVVKLMQLRPMDD